MKKFLKGTVSVFDFIWNDLLFPYVCYDKNSETEHRRHKWTISEDVPVFKGTNQYIEGKEIKTKYIVSQRICKRCSSVEHHNSTTGWEPVGWTKSIPK